MVVCHIERNTRSDFRDKMYFSHKILIEIVFLTVCIGVSEQSVIELIKTRESTDFSTSTTSKPVDNLVAVNDTTVNHRKGRCKSKILLKGVSAGGLYFF